MTRVEYQKEDGCKKRGNHHEIVQTAKRLRRRTKNWIDRRGIFIEFDIHSDESVYNADLSDTVIVV